MIKNIVLKSLYRISGPGTIQGKLGEMVLHYDQYRNMQDLSIQSMQANLLGEWELIELSGVFEDLASSFIHTFIQTHKIWREHAPCNILYVDPDVLCVRPMDIWQIAPNRMWLPDLSNCGVRYFDRLMPPIQWSTAYEMLKFWDYDNYSYEQSMYQAMDLCFALAGAANRCTTVNQYSNYEQRFVELAEFSEAFIHVHASRNPQMCLQQLRYLWDTASSS